MTEIPEAIGAYLATVRDEQRAALHALRATIMARVPEVVECISYRLPAFRYRGKVLVGYGATPHHCALYLMSHGIVVRFRAALTGFDTSTGTVRFSPDHPLPDGLVHALIDARIREVLGHAPAEG